MKNRRNSFEVICKILSELSMNTAGMGPTQIMNLAGVPYRLTIDYLNTLKRKRIVKVKKGAGAIKEVYTITPHGLEVYRKLRDFLDIWEDNGKTKKTPAKE